MRKIKMILIGISIGLICEIVLCLAISVVLFAPRKLSTYLIRNYDEIVEMEISISNRNNAREGSKTIVLTDCDDLAQSILNTKVTPNYLDWFDPNQINFSVMMVDKNNNVINIYESSICVNSYITLDFRFEIEIYNMIINYLEENNIEY